MHTATSLETAAVRRRPARRGRPRRHRRRDRLHRPGAAAPAGAASGASRLTLATSSSAASAARRLPALARLWDGAITPLDPDALAREADLVFLALPDTAAAELAPALVDAGVRVIDLSGAFRLRDAARARALVSGNARAAGRAWPTASPSSSATRCAARGSWPTPAAIRRRRCWRWRRSRRPACSCAGADIIVDAKSGVSGAGKTPSERTHFSEVHGSLSAYGVFGHRHGAEIEQGLGRDGHVHAAPACRSIAASWRRSTCACAPGTTEEALGDVYQRGLRRRDRSCGSSARRCPRSSTSRTRISATSAGASTRPAASILVSVIDNLLKGASGQAVQNMNVMLGRRRDDRPAVSGDGRSS